MPAYVAYYRVSTAKQGRSGLGLEAQRTAVRAFTGAPPIAEYTEIESGKSNARPELRKALDHAELAGATLAIAKLDRLSRNAAFLLALRDSGARFVAVDMPEANNLTVGIMALVAENEREAISSRTKVALAAAKARGVRLGGDRGNLPATCQEAARQSAERRRRESQSRACKVVPHIEAARMAGARTLRQIAAHLNAAGFRTPRGSTWTAAAVQRAERAAGG